MLLKDTNGLFLSPVTRRGIREENIELMLERILESA